MSQNSKFGIIKMFEGREKAGNGLLVGEFKGKYLEFGELKSLAGCRDAERRIRVQVRECREQAGVEYKIRENLQRSDFAEHEEGPYQAQVDPLSVLYRGIQGRGKSGESDC